MPSRHLAPLLCHIALACAVTSKLQAGKRGNGLCAPTDNADDCLALADLYWATGKKIAWPMNGSSLCTWGGVLCNATSGRVASLGLGANSLSGTIPSELAGLSPLTALGLGANSLSGTIPSELAGLSRLTWLWLDDNSLSGTIPSGLAGLLRTLLEMA